MNFKFPNEGLIVLNYSFGPYFNEEIGGENHVTLWRILNGKLDSVYHQGEPEEFDYEHFKNFLDKNKIRSLYSPSVELFYKKNNVFDLVRDRGPRKNIDENGDITDWVDYDPLCYGDYNESWLKSNGLELIIFNKT